jgi:hypothetical protein
MFKIMNSAPPLPAKFMPMRERMARAIHAHRANFMPRWEPDFDKHGAAYPTARAMLLGEIDAALDPLDVLMEPNGGGDD